MSKLLPKIKAKLEVYSVYQKQVKDLMAEWAIEHNKIITPEQQKQIGDLGEELQQKLDSAESKIEALKAQLKPFLLEHKATVDHAGYQAIYNTKSPKIAIDDVLHFIGHDLAEHPVLAKRLLSHIVHPDPHMSLKAAPKPKT